MTGSLHSKRKNERIERMRETPAEKAISGHWQGWMLKEPLDAANERHWWRDNHFRRPGKNEEA